MMQTSEVPSGGVEPWGKFDRLSGSFHHLAHHCADVAAAFLIIADYPVWRERLERAAGHSFLSTELERLAVLVFLHDIGKLFPTFQAKGWPEGVWSGHLSGHVCEAIDVLCHLPDPSVAEGLHVERLAAWIGETGLFEAILAHHGRPVIIEGDRRAKATTWRDVARYSPTKAARAIGELLPVWFPLAFSEPDRPLVSTPAFEHLFAGLVALADWIGSSRSPTDFVATLDRDYMAMAKRNAVDRLAAIGIDAAAQRTAIASQPTFAAVSGRSTPNAQQALIAQTDLNARLVILEAETGSGKTEAALWRFAQLFASGKIDGLYFAVPTRAAAKQLHGRVNESAKRLFGAADPQAVLAVPGYLRAGEISGTPLPNWRVRWDDDEGAEERKLEARWAAEDSKKYLAAQIAVGTVDQAMLAALAVKHAHVRGACLSRSLLVLDEVHASDRYMGVIQKRLLNHHTQLGGYAMLMSATLGSNARALWLGHKPSPSLDQAIATPYPAVWTSASSSPARPAGAPSRSKSVAMSTLNTMDATEAAKRALVAARRGARVLVIRNTVMRAIETLQAVKAIAGDNEQHLIFSVRGISTLHHSRFAPADREILDAAVEDALSTKANRPSGGRIVIGTQTLEQSLDICADYLISDLCPVDVLLQRIGRLHRHDLQRPAGFEQPMCAVLVPAEGLAPLLAPKFENGLGAWMNKSVPMGIYPDLSIIELTRRLISQHATWTIPEMNRELVERAMHDDAIAALHTELGQAWIAYSEKIYGVQFANAQAAGFVLLDQRVGFAGLQFPDDDERIRTRLGADGARLILSTPERGPFGSLISEFVLPAHWHAQISDDEQPICRRDPEGRLVIETSNERFVYDSCGLRRQTAR